MLNHRIRYLQIAFNYDQQLVFDVLSTIEDSDRIIMEAGTPYIKREGMDGVRMISNGWSGPVVADMKVTDGAATEVRMAHNAGATAVTAMGSSPVETLDIFVEACQQQQMESMIDMLGVADPLKVVMQMQQPPDVVVLHRGRDEEGTRGKTIQYKHVNRLRSKFDVLISAAGGVDLREARSAIFNGANIVVVNLVRPGDPWQGIATDTDVAGIAAEFLETIS